MVTFHIPVPGFCCLFTLSALLHYFQDNFLEIRANQMLTLLRHCFYKKDCIYTAL